MPPAQHILFPPFRLDPVNERLWRGKQGLALRPKTFAVLRYLLLHPDQLVTKSDVLDAVWPNISVSEGVLKVCIQELRAVLEDEPRAPRFIETVHRRGYRFIGKMATAEPPQADPRRQRRGATRHTPRVQRHRQGSGAPIKAPRESRTAPRVRLVGREAELERLHQALTTAQRGERQVVLVTGEPGLGKTTLVNAFLQRAAAAEQDLWIVRSQCVEYYGTGEAYLPVLEALERSCRRPGGQGLVTLLWQYAPTWLAQLPGLLTVADRRALQRELQGTTRERMLREMVAVVEALTSASLCILLLEDLQWSDYSTVDLLAALARRPEPARLLLIGTYRPGEVLGSGHPLPAVQRTLQMHGQCTELALAPLSAVDVAAYLAGRFPTLQTPTGLARVLRRRTAGNPLFMGLVVQEWVVQGLLVQREGRWSVEKPIGQMAESIPDSILRVIAKQSERLSAEEQHLLAAASVVGVEFSAAAVAATLDGDVVEIEARLEGLA